MSRIDLILSVLPPAEAHIVRNAFERVILEIIGSDEDIEQMSRVGYPERDTNVRNQLRAELRKKVEDEL